MAASGQDSTVDRATDDDGELLGRNSCCGVHVFASDIKPNADGEVFSQWYDDDVHGPVLRCLLDEHGERTAECKSAERRNKSTERPFPKCVQCNREFDHATDLEVPPVLATGRGRDGAVKCCQTGLCWQRAYGQRVSRSAVAKERVAAAAPAPAQPVPLLPLPPEAPPANNVSEADCKAAQPEPRAFFDFPALEPAGGSSDSKAGAEAGAEAEAEMRRLHAMIGVRCRCEHGH